jgi:hypothetical protein
MTDAMGADMMAEGEESAAEGASHGMEIPARQQAGEAYGTTIRALLISILPEASKGYTTKNQCSNLNGFGNDDL